MPNIRQMRKRENKTCKWSKEAMEQAMQEVRAGRLTARQAAQKFGIPKSSLSDRLSGRVAAGCVHGQKQFLTPEDENSLVEYCLYSASHSVPLVKSQIVAHALAIYNYRNPDKPKTLLGQTWWINFRERHQHRLANKTPDIIVHGKESCTSLLSPTPAALTPLSPDAAHPSSNPYHTHPLVASGRITADLLHVLSNTKQTCNIGKVRRNQVLTAKVKSDVIKEVEDSAAGRDAQTPARGGRVQQQEAEDTSPAVTSSTLPGGTRRIRKRSPPFGAPPATSSDHSTTGPSAVFAPTSASHGPSVLTPSRTPSHLNLPSKDQHHQIEEAPNLWQTSSTPPAPPSYGSPSTTGPTTSTSHRAVKRQKQERKVLRCGRCRQPHPPQDPQGLVLWVQCDNCHKLFHTICVSSEMDLAEDEFWCFWCLDV